MADTVIFLTSGTSFTRPADWNNSANKIEAIGGGGDGNVSFATNGACYAAITNYAMPSTMTYQIGVHGGTTGSRAARSVGRRHDNHGSGLRRQSWRY